MMPRTAPVDCNRPASVDGVLALVRGFCQPLEVERLPLADAWRRVLRESIRAAEDQPPFDRSSVDGYALRLDDAGHQFHIVDDIRAGDWKPRPLQPGEAVRIATGGALPCEKLQVLMKEDVIESSGCITAPRRGPDRNIRFRGEDARLGQTLLESGTILQPGALALLASLGCVQPPVTRLPRVLHIVTGNEIVPPNQSPSRGQVRDANSTLVRVFLEQWKIESEQARAGEDKTAIQETLAGSGEPMARYDLLLISGGASVGDHDFTRSVLEELGFVIQVSHTAARPGKPLIVAHRGGTLAFGLPGNPLAHFVCLHLYVRAALEAWSGQSSRNEFLQGELEAELIAGAGRRETFWPARWTLRDGIAMLLPLRWSSSGDLTALATANALIRVPSSAERCPGGTRAQFLRADRV
jgi:molybdopterin molybdotransferase